MSILKFDSNTRQSSRRREVAAGARKAAQAERKAAKALLAIWERGQRAERQRLAKVFGVTEVAIDANGGRLYNFGQELETIEAAYAHSPAKGRQAVIATLNEYFNDGYESGKDDGATYGHRAAQGIGR